MMQYLNYPLVLSFSLKYPFIGTINSSIYPKYKKSKTIKLLREKRQHPFHTIKPNFMQVTFKRAKMEVSFVHIPLWHFPFYFVFSCYNLNKSALHLWFTGYWPRSKGDNALCSVRLSVCLSGCTQGTLYTTTTVYGVLVHQEGAICTTQAQYAPQVWSNYGVITSPKSVSVCL